MRLVLERRPDVLIRAMVAVIGVCVAGSGAVGGGMARISTSDGFDLQAFGKSLAVDGSLAIVGAAWDGFYCDPPYSPTWPGGAYVFDISDPMHPVQVSSLRAPDGNECHGFGMSAAVSGSVGLVGAIGDWGHAGAVYIADLTDPGAPPALIKLRASDFAQSRLFGSAIAKSGSITVVGAPGSGFQAAHSGSVYLYDLSDLAQAVELVQFTGSDSLATDRFGAALALEGSLLAVGAFRHTTDVEIAGAVYLFDISDPSQPVELSKLTASDGEFGDSFGRRVAVNGSVLVVSSVADDDLGQSAGAVYVFDISDPTQPVELKKITASDGREGAAFGESVAISGSTLVVGADKDRPGFGHTRGAVYVFDISDPGDPIELRKFAGIDSSPSSTHLGITAAMQGPVLFSGATGDGAGGDGYRGAVYITDLSLRDGDADMDGAIDVNDISFVLFRLGDACGAGLCDGDVNCDGVVDVNDISYVLFRLGSF